MSIELKAGDTLYIDFAQLMVASKDMTIDTIGHATTAIPIEQALDSGVLLWVREKPKMEES